MGLLELIMLSLALAMDCFAVSVVCGVTEKKRKAALILRIAFLFGFFQAAMPLLGWLGMSLFSTYVESFDHWIAFGMLAFIGGKMIADAFSKEEEKTFDPEKPMTEIVLAIATSIDALAVGISFACTGYDSLSSMILPLLVIGLGSFLLSVTGHLLGLIFGDVIGRRLKPELLGGVILVLIGLRILLEHLEVL